MTKAIISGVVGQTGSFCADLLLEKGCEVYGIIRRTSQRSTQNIDHLACHENFYLVNGDITDAECMSRIVRVIKPDYFYHYAAQSYVGISWDQPHHTISTNVMGTLNVLEAIRSYSPLTKVYLASSSEIFGNQPENLPYNENTLAKPVSPYGISKVVTKDLGHVYRDSHGLHVAVGVCFNNESIPEWTPIIYKYSKNGYMDIKPISELVESVGINFDRNLNKYQESKVNQDLFIWDDNSWTKVKFASAYPNLIKNDKKPIMLNTPNSAFVVTSDHKVILENETTKAAKNIKKGSTLKTTGFPKISHYYKKYLSEKEAELIGLIVGDGSINKNNGELRITNSDNKILDRVRKLWFDITNHKCSLRYSISGFNSRKKIPYLSLLGSRNWLNKFHLYTKSKKKRIPLQILNGNKNIKLAFLRGYYKADGLKGGYPLKYEFKSFGTNSECLAAGLLLIIKSITGQEYNITVLKSKNKKHEFFYHINLLSNSTHYNNPRNSIIKYNIVKPLLDSNMSMRVIHRETGINRGFISRIKNGYIPDGNNHLSKSKNVVKKIISMKNCSHWFYDLETESGTFHCGVGQGNIHNSERRGLQFVTRKITNAVAKIKHGQQEYVELGNLDAKRDWTYARDTAEASIMMLENGEATDYVVATGKAHSIAEFAKEAFKVIDILDWQNYIRITEFNKRPNDIEVLVGNPSKIRKLGWVPRTSFYDMVNIMVAHDLNVVRSEKKKVKLGESISTGG